MAVHHSRIGTPGEFSDIWPWIENVSGIFTGIRAKGSGAMVLQPDADNKKTHTTEQNKRIIRSVLKKFNTIILLHLTVEIKAKTIPLSRHLL